MEAEGAAPCAGCGTPMPARLLSCPACGRLAHLARLEALREAAETQEREGRIADAIGSWREALRMLPLQLPATAQIGERIDSLMARPEARAQRQAAKAGRGLAGAGVLAVLVAGALKLPALAGIFGMLVVLWGVYGWKLAVGVLVSLYVHELGHVVAMARRGLPLSAPMFVPGLGAYVRMSERPASPVEDNRIGLAGPLAGMVVAIACAVAGAALHVPLLLATASAGAFINLFNLAPVWQLDGARGFASLVRWQRLAVAAAFGVAGALTQQGMLGILAVVAAGVAVTQPPAAKPDAVGFATFLGLIGALALLASSVVAPR